MRRVGGLDWCVAAAFAVCLVLAAMAVTHSRRLACEHQGPRVQAEQEPNSPLEEQPPSQSRAQAAGDGAPGQPQIIPSPPSRETENYAKQCDNEGSESLPLILGYKVKITDAFLVIFTLMLAIYTKELSSSTVKLWEAAKDQGADTKRAIAEASRSADAAARQAEAAAEALAMTRADQRAYLIAQPAGHTFVEWRKGRARPVWQFNFANIGKTPAVINSIEAFTSISQDAPNPLDCIQPRGGLFPISGSTSQLAVHTRIVTAFGQSEAFSIVNPEGPLGYSQPSNTSSRRVDLYTYSFPDPIDNTVAIKFYVVGRVKYSDVFTVGDRCTEFAFYCGGIEGKTYVEDREAYNRRT